MDNGLLRGVADTPGGRGNPLGPKLRVADVALSAGGGMLPLPELQEGERPSRSTLELTRLSGGGAP